MRALHVAAGNLFGGVERVLVEIAGAAGGWRHEFALSYDGRLQQELTERAAIVHPLGEVRFSRPITLWRARRRLTRLCSESMYDAVVCHSPWAYALAAPASARQRRILWAHNALDGSHWTERRASRTTPDLVICNSEYTSRAVGGWLGSVPRVVVYPPLAPGPETTGMRTDIRRTLGAASDTTVIVLASRFERLKGHAALLEAVATLDGEWMVWIAGDAQRPSEDALSTELHAFVTTRGLAQRVRFLGERRDVPEILRAADVLCQPNLAPESFGLAFVEALYAGIPVVTSDIGGAREIVTAECGILLPPGNVSALRDALQGLVSNPQRRRELGAAGPSRARSLCDPVEQIHRLEQALAPRAEQALA